MGFVLYLPLTNGMVKFIITFFNFAFDLCLLSNGFINGKIMTAFFPNGEVRFMWATVKECY